MRHALALLILAVISLPAMAQDNNDETPPAGEVCPARTSTTECKHPDDCPSWQSCGTRTDGKKVCMGAGEQNDFCANTLDCLGALTCHPRIKDGLRVCMGDGQKGDCCRMSVQCSGSLMCKNRGDGFYVCL